MTADMIFYFHFLYRNVFLEFTMPNKFLYSRSWGWRMVCLEKSLLQDKLKKLSFFPNKRTKKRRNLSKKFSFFLFRVVLRLYQISRLHKRQLHWAKIQWENDFFFILQKLHICQDSQLCHRSHFQITNLSY